MNALSFAKMERIHRQFYMDKFIYHIAQNLKPVKLAISYYKS